MDAEMFESWDVVWLTGRWSGPGRRPGGGVTTWRVCLDDYPPCTLAPSLSGMTVDGRTLSGHE